MAKYKTPTATSLVAAHLRSHDDFFTAQMLATATGRTVNNVTSALHALRDYHVVDAIEQAGKLWWYALPVEQDQRVKHIDERTPESKPRRSKRRKARPTTGGH